MKRFLLPALLFALTVSCAAQTQTSSGDNSPNIMGAVSINPSAKPSPASDALVKSAQESTVQQKQFDAAFQTAKAALDAKVKDLQQQNIDLNQQLNTQMRADKKYKPMFDKIDAIQKQIAALNNDATAKFQQIIGSIQTQIATNKALMDGLEPVVRKENGWPETTTFDRATQTWKGIPQPATEKK